MYEFEVTVSAVGSFQKILFNTVAHMYWTIWCKCYRWIKIEISNIIHRYNILKRYNIRHIQLN